MGVLELAIFQAQEFGGDAGTYTAEEDWDE